MARRQRCTVHSHHRFGRRLRVRSHWLQVALCTYASKMGYQRKRSATSCGRDTVVQPRSSVDVDLIPRVHTGDQGAVHRRRRIHRGICVVQSLLGGAPKASNGADTVHAVAGPSGCRGGSGGNNGKRLHATWSEDGGCAANTDPA